MTLSTDNSREQFVSALAEQNRRFYGSTDGLATLRALEFAFDHRWQVTVAAKWLSAQIADSTGKRFWVRPVVVYPG